MPSVENSQTTKPRGSDRRGTASVPYEGEERRKGERRATPRDPILS